MTDKPEENADTCFHCAINDLKDTKFPDVSRVDAVQAMIELVFDYTLSDDDPETATDELLHFWQYYCEEVANNRYKNFRFEESLMVRTNKDKLN